MVWCFQWSGSGKNAEGGTGALGILLQPAFVIHVKLEQMP